MTVFRMNYFKAEFQKIAKNISVEESVLRSATGRGSGTSKKTPPAATSYGKFSEMFSAFLKSCL